MKLVKFDIGLIALFTITLSLSALPENHGTKTLDVHNKSKSNNSLKENITLMLILPWDLISAMQRANTAFDEQKTTIQPLHEHYCQCMHNQNDDAPRFKPLNHEGKEILKHQLPKKLFKKREAKKEKQLRLPSDYMEQSDQTITTKYEKIFFMAGASFMALGAFLTMYQYVTGSGTTKKSMIPSANITSFLKNSDTLFWISYSNNIPNSHDTIDQFSIFLLADSINLDDINTFEQQLAGNDTFKPILLGLTTNANAYKELIFLETITKKTYGLVKVWDGMAWTVQPKSATKTLSKMFNGQILKKLSEENKALKEAA